MKRNCLLPEEVEYKKDDGMRSVEITAYLQVDNGESFSLEEILYKLQNLMANKELGDHIFFEDLKYLGYECRDNGLLDEERRIHSFYVICGS